MTTSIVSKDIAEKQDRYNQVLYLNAALIERLPRINTFLSSVKTDLAQIRHDFQFLENEIYEIEAALKVLQSVYEYDMK